jgi:hypothetical protein
MALKRSPEESLFNFKEMTINGKVTTPCGGHIYYPIQIL